MFSFVYDYYTFLVDGFTSMQYTSLFLFILGFKAKRINITESTFFSKKLLGISFSIS